VNPGQIFISHASKDDNFVKQLRIALESHQLSVWVDSRDLRGGAKLEKEIEEAIEQARQVIAVLSPDTINSPWVRREIQKALEVEKRRKADGYCVIPLLLPGVEPSALALWFDEEPVGLKIQLQVGGLSEAMPRILAALGERAPDDIEPAAATEVRPLEELILKLGEPRIETRDGKRRAKAKAQLIYQPADHAARKVESAAYYFTAPLGPIEADDLRWYLEQFYLWPAGIFVERARTIEEKLPQWGQEIFHAAVSTAPAALNAWLQTDDRTERRFSVEVDSDVIEDPNQTDEEKQAAKAEAGEAATELLSLPWELLHDGRGFLFHGANPVRVRRRLPNRHPQKSRPTRLPIRILLLSPRPEEEGVGWIDHRISARPLVEAIEELGDLATLTMLNPPTFPALVEELQRASEANQQYDVIHFDGHGIYDRRVGLGGLCFEDPQDSDKPIGRAMQLIHAEKLAEVIRDHRVPLVFLEACQSAKTEENPTASVAARLLQEGVTSVVAMSHSVLVETARRFVAAFYRSLAEGKRVGAAMLAGQRALHGDTWRGKVMGAGDLRLQDWFVPVLYQEEQDPLLVTRRPSKAAQQVQQKPRRIRLGALPPDPPHSFIGRSRELLALERLLNDDRQRYVIVRGVGGQGKTTLAAELARWLVRTSRFERAAFVSLEQYTDTRGVLDSIGRQILPEGANWSVAQFSDLRQALLPVERALRDHPTIILLDNLESVLPSNYGVQSADFSRNASDAEPLPAEVGTLNAVSESGNEHDAAIAEIFNLCCDLLDADPVTRLLFTTREPLPAPFDQRHREITLGALSREEAIELVSQIMAHEGLTPKTDDPGGDPREITDLVEEVNCHARALTLLAREVARRGVRATTEDLHQLMAELDRKHPGDRVNSLYASVELSLRRLPPEMQRQIKPLGVFHGGAYLGTLPYVLDVDVETAKNIGRALVEVGLAEAMPYGHLRLDPALQPYLLRGLTDVEQEATRSRWAKAARQLTVFLHEQRFQNAELSARLTLLELPNLMALLDWMQEHATPEEVVDLAVSVERMLARLSRQKALTLVTRIREQAAFRLGKESEWSRARFTADCAKIDRLLERGQLQAAFEAAQQLLDRSLAAGEAAYSGADYDIVMAHWMLGRVLRKGGAAEAALAPLGEAQRHFQAFVDAGNTSVARMASITITEMAACLTFLGRLDEAEAAYQEALRRFEKLDDRRMVAVGNENLGLVLLRQRRYQEALEAYTEAVISFERLGEPGSLVGIWHQIGIVHSEAGQFEQAESAYKQSLAIAVREKFLANEAGSMNGLGILYNQIGRLEDAVKCYRQAAEIHVRLQDQRSEGIDRSNLASTLIKLQRYDEARRELLRATECIKSYDHAAEPWKIWEILYDLEQATGHSRGAAEARQQAYHCYLAYRRDGGQSYDLGAQICTDCAQFIQSGDQSATTALAQELAKLLETDIRSFAKVLFPKLQAILGGSRDAALADDPALFYQDAVELQLLLEALGAN